MDSEIIETGVKLSPIIVALIGAVAGLISGALASLIAPWVQYAIESKKKSIEYKKQKIQELKNLLEDKTTLDEIEKSPLWGFISENLNKEERKTVYPGAIVVHVSLDHSKDTLTQDDYKKQGISKMIYRLEKEWGLINA